MTYTQSCNAARFGHIPHLLLCAALTLVLSACGGADGTSSDGTTASTSSTTTTTTTTTTSTAAPPTASDTAVTPPSISGTPATTATVGVAYSFQPGASSSNSGALTWSITNKPAWATFNAATGQLSGTPASSDVGTDAAIVITVGHGNATASLAAFTITVAAAANPTPTQGSATLSWAAPAQNTDGSSITNLSGYVISYGSSPSTLTQTVTVSDPTATSYTLQSLVAGTWYFAVRAVESGGVTSALSSVVSTTIQ